MTKKIKISKKIPETKYWLARIAAAEKSGYTGSKATAKFFKEMLKHNKKN